MDKLEILKLKAEVANCERIAKTSSDCSVSKALLLRATELKDKIAKAEKSNVGV